MELKGTIKKIGQIETFLSGFKKREVVLTTDEQYPQPISIEFLQDKTDLVDAYKEGDSVTVGINLRGREWVSPQGDTKYFNSIVGWKIIKSVSNDVPDTHTAKPYNETPNAGNDEDDDLPF